MKINFKSIILSSSIAILAFGFLFNPNFAFADDGSFCEVSADVILVLDISGSMEDGGSQSKCEWSEIKPYEGTSTYFLNTKYDVSEEWCSGVKDSFDESVPSFSFSPVTYTPEALSKIESAKNAAKSFLDNLKSQDQSGLVSFSDTANLEKGLSSDHNATKTAVDTVITGGATNIGDAIAFATAEFNGNANPQATKTIILLTDGKANKPNGSGSGEDPLDVAYALEKAAEAGSLGYKVFTIGLGSDGDINAGMLQEIAALTGATYHHAPNGDGLEDIYNEISQEICEYSSISGCKYEDMDPTDEIFTTDTPLSDWEIVLGGDDSQSQLTDQNGCYTFAGLSEGNYMVSEGTNSSFLPFSQTYPQGFYDVALSYGQNEVNYDFANYFPVCGNNILDSSEGEQCDDGNLDDGDGCSSICQIEQEEPEPGEIQPGDIVINEIMQNPKGTTQNPVPDTTGEWFEIYNTTDSSIDLIGCVIRDDGSNSHTITSLGVPAHGYSVLARSANLAMNGGIMPNYVYSSFSLGNTDDEIILDCNSIEIDRVDYDGNFPLADGASMTLADPSLDNNVGGNWCTSTTPYGAGDLGTPGSLNDSCGGQDEETFYEIIASAGTGGAISPLGSVQVVSGGNQAFSMTPDSGYEISDVLADSISLGAIDYYTFDNVTSNHTILVNFSLMEQEPEPDPDPDPDPDPPATYTITATAGSCGSIAPSGAISVSEESDQTFDITANSGCEILDVLVDSAFVGAVDTYTFYDVASDHTIEATFYELPSGGGGGGSGGTGFPIFMITSSAGLNGSIDPLGTVAVNYGYSKQYTMAPDSGYEVEDVLVDGSSVGALISYTFGNVVLDHTISASFKASGEVAGAATEALYIFEEQTGAPLENSVILTWKTNLPATTRVVYDTVSHIELGEAPNYGYSFSTEENSEKVEYHIVLISGLEPNTTYYWRAVSHGSGEVIGQELSFSTKELSAGIGGPLPPPEETGQAVGAGGTVLGEAITEQDGAETTPEEQTLEETSPEQQLVVAPELFLAVLPLGKIWEFVKNNFYWILFLILIALVVYLIYREWKRRTKNKQIQ